MELVITEKADDNSVKFRCDLCDYNPYQAWCKGNTARFHAALMKHKQTTRHREAEAFARGEQPVSISKGGVISADVPHPPTQPYYISKLENMIDKLEQRIDALNYAFEPSEASSEYNLNNLGSLVDDFRQNGYVQKSQKNGDLVISPTADIESRQSPVSIPQKQRDVLYAFQFKGCWKSLRCGTMAIGRPSRTRMLWERFVGCCLGWRCMRGTRGVRRRV